ncbi:MAG TPA: inositol monophosphatase family protein [Euzebya sp.]|nr:inositol monophosphatase family protein [Euzebya sp.]
MTPTTTGTGSSLLGDLDLALAIASDAGDLALSYLHRGVMTLQKGSRDLVSEADRAVERLIVDRLAEAFPADFVVGEEGTGGGLSPPADTRCWYVDPIDGTTNYLKGLPSWGVSIGLADHDGTLLVGVIVLPVSGEVFTAARGGGARRNGVPIRCSTEARLERTLLAHAHSPGSAEQWGGPGALTAATAGLMGQVLGTRLQGCSVADLASVAMGRIDATFAGGMSPWDVAAGLLIAAEAGARITTPDGRTSVGPDSAFLASSHGVHEALRAVLAQHGAIPEG